jgi:eukaryotic-like serine/threonine-protein kinase
MMDGKACAGRLRNMQQNELAPAPEDDRKFVSMDEASSLEGRQETLDGFTEGRNETFNSDGVVVAEFSTTEFDVKKAGRGEAGFSLDIAATRDMTEGLQRLTPTTNIPQTVGDYEIKRILGRGGMGIVYCARDRKLERDVALKMVLSGAHASEEQLQRFVSEAKAVAHLQHPNIVQIFEVGEQDGLPFFSLEFVDGLSLDKLVRGKTLPYLEAAKLIETLARVMQYAHQHGVLHRDLKPANVLLTKAGIPKVTDFGLAKRLEDVGDSASTRTGTIMGTPSYMSPEQASGLVRELGPATDQYSLGAMLYEFLTGRPPFLAANPFETILQVIRDEPVAPRQFQAKIPVDLETICLKSLQKEAAKRYPSCDAMADDLGRYIRGEPIKARPIGPVERGIGWCRRNPLVSTLASAVSLSLVVVAIVSTWSAFALGNKNSELAQTNAKLNTANSDLRITNEALTESNAENTRRSKRLELYVQDVFREVNKLNIAEDPRVRTFKDDTLQKTLPLIEEYTKELPEGGQGDATKMSALLELSRSYRDQNMGPKAEQTLQALVVLARKRVEVQQGSDAARSNLCVILTDLSRIQLELNRDMQASRRTLEEALEIAGAVTEESRAAPNGLGQFPRYRSMLLQAEIEHNLAVTRFRQGNSEAAVAHYQRSIANRLKVIDDFRSGTAMKESAINVKPLSEEEVRRTIDTVELQISIGQLALASAFNRSGQTEKAASLFQEVVAETERRVQPESSNAINLRRLAGTLGTWGEFLAWQGRTSEAMTQFLRAAKLCEQMLQKNTESTELNRAAATAFHRLAQWQYEVDKEQANAWGTKALMLRSSAAARDPKNDRHQLEWMQSCARFGDTSIAESIATRYISASARDPEMMIEISQSLAQCSVRSDQDRDALLQAAFKALSIAIELGFQDSVYLECEIDLAPLRIDTRWEQLVLRQPR